MSPLGRDADGSELTSGRERFLHDRIWWPLVAAGPLFVVDVFADWNYSLLEFIGAVAVLSVVATWRWRGWEHWQQRRRARGTAQMPQVRLAG